MRITIIGSGNIATQLGLALLKAGHEIVSVYSKNYSHATVLAKTLHAQALKNSIEISTNTDLILIAVNDDAIEDVAAALRKTNAIVTHTSGSVSIDVLIKYFKNCGVLYPLQSINKNRKIVFKNVPVCVEGSNKIAGQKLLELASSVSKNIFQLNSKQRLAVHVAAVFANNFSNHVMHLAEEILKENNLPFNLLRPLIATTAKKVQDDLPSQIQTGPAKRNDIQTIEKHLAFLKGDEVKRKIYKMMSESIAGKK